ncbi:GntR family transcriptional regulator / MocR family aminotransferase [Paenibacillus sp. UNCCL117]|uniref:MocR-like pyridoxine biosynthesis transcription factor PdxR n=1 Tax=unclassified Paenibacillus TaxID=185978 RepID=UPI00088B05E2|nr:MULTISPECIES: PLP-dependent aminotransferase family protein [unclassified Paenibacillus]SDD32254.1 GntR family transcriptional regulator / MocR family aminotransferase [Paenibacillus sp. cl123]SFW39888.1 GntR family transcriptional regulator / MocR family aminotransferase [Paenibacillus sp. UNCCL117]
MDFPIPYEAYARRHPTKHEALYEALRDTIVNGRLGFGMRLPSTRELAALYGLSRGTVNQVYETLASEGYVVSSVGRGTSVAYRYAPPAAHSPAEEAEDDFHLSAWAQRLTEPPSEPRLQAAEAQSAIINFASGRTDRRLFPREAWNRCLYAQIRAEEGRGEGDGSGAQGDNRLREAIAMYLRRTRGLRAQANHIAVVHGSMQALALIAQLVLNPGDRAVAETPAYSGVRRAIRSAGGHVIDAAVDSAGIRPEEWEARALFVTPSRQFPTGAVLSLERRQALLAWASSRRAVIVEDDYDSEFRHRGRSIEPLKALDRENRVVYVGSFTKTMPPSLRIGYAVLPEPLVKPFVLAQALYEPVSSNVLEQRALAAFMASGGYERHLRRMKRTYGRKFARLADLLQSRLSGLFDWVPSDAGLHLFGWWKGGPAAYEAYRSACRTAGVLWADAPPAESGAEAGRQGAYFHFSDLSEEEMEEGVRRMCELDFIVKEHMRS